MSCLSPSSCQLSLVLVGGGRDFHPEWQITFALFRRNPDLFNIILWHAVDVFFFPLPGHEVSLNHVKEYPACAATMVICVYFPGCFYSVAWRASFLPFQLKPRFFVVGSLFLGPRVLVRARNLRQLMGTTPASPHRVARIFHSSAAALALLAWVSCPCQPTFQLYLIWGFFFFICNWSHFFFEVSNTLLFPTWSA